MKNWVPQTPSQFRFWITETAVLEFRRLCEPELKPLEQHQLAKQLDERIFAAFSAKRSTDIVDRDVPDVTSKVVELEGRDGSRLFAVMRPHKHGYPAPKVVGGPNGLGLAVVTVISKDHASSSYASGRWQMPNRPFAEKLQGVTVRPNEPPKPAKTEEPEERRGHRARHGTLVDRIEFAKDVLRKRPNITIAGEDGLSRLVEKQFGIGMSGQTINRLKTLVSAERGSSPAPVVFIEAPKPEPVAAVVATPPQVAPKPAGDHTIALQFAQAIEAEKLAKARVATAQRELEAAQTIASGATEQVEQLLSQMQAQRA